MQYRGIDRFTDSKRRVPLCRRDTGPAGGQRHRTHLPEERHPEVGEHNVQMILLPLLIQLCP